MTRRPHMKLRVGDIDVVYSYEQRGNLWILYRREASEAPGAVNQHSYATVIECHEAWVQQCIEAINGAEELLAPAADIGTRQHIAVILGDV